ncbi:hypothetical protein LZ554_005254 [Drepanopeziza brunnea f. sp. 'monogermtubi']|nr:hypothetical protein LZ554_005254 [Drepanopeziza brunnea f. sp. 'monogermtubi']
MEDSAVKRRKLSPTTSIPIDAPATPSRIPVPRADGAQPASRRPSFASPTKASLSRHHPQILSRPLSSGAGNGRPPSRSKDLQDVFGRALGETQTGKVGQSVISKDDREGSRSMSTTQENDPSAWDHYDMSQKTPPGGRSKEPVGAGMIAKPNRLPQSPKKQPERSALMNYIAEVLPEAFNPFQKKGLRRSPIISSAEAPPPAVVHDSMDVDENSNPFRKAGLRRSPISSQPQKGLRRSPIPAQPVETIPRGSPTPPQHLTSGRALDEFRVSPVRSQPLQPSPRKSPFPSRSALRRSPVFSQDINPIHQASQISEQRLLSTQEIIPATPAKPPPPPRRLFAEITRDVDVSEPENASSEARQQVASAPLEPISQPKMSFTETPKPQEEQIEAPIHDAEPTYKLVHEPVPEAIVSTTPTEPPPKVSSVVESRDYSMQEQERTPVPKMTQRPQVPSIDVHDLFHGTRRVEKPELRPTPTQLKIPDPVVTTSPTGTPDTPSMRARNRKLKISPLRPRGPSPQEPMEPVPLPLTELKAEKPKRRKSSRFMIPEDPHAAKKRARDDLLKELQQLQADVALANRENERLRIRSASKKKGHSTAPNPDELQSMLIRSTAPEPSSDARPKPTSIFQSINAFLPFRPRRRPAIAPVSKKPLPSHLPIALTDPLPYLQAFSPLNYSSTITILPCEPSLSENSSQFEEQPVMQRHVISASHPSGLFSTRFSMTVDTSSLSIAALDILRLDMNAEKELGTFIRARARSDSVLGKDVTVVCWAMSRWIEVSIQRARFWCAIEHEFGTPQARAQTLLKKKKRKRQGAPDAIADGMEVEESEDRQIWTRRQMLPHIGRTGAELSNSEVELRFEWKISFDWTGEVESAITASARLPGAWQHADDRSSLAKVPDTFDKLVKERGPLGAVRATVGIFMPV